MTPLWVFGYASLTWNPGFDFEESVIGTLPGYRRSFSMRSIHHRGTPEAPGLVLALHEETGAACTGLGFRVAPQKTEATLDYLRARELISSAYLERSLPLMLEDGREVRAVTYVLDTGHAQYCKGLPLEDQAQIIARAVGGRGPNTEYLYNTATHLRDLGIEDAELTWLETRVRALDNV
ncbi:gamma-glutamylcyclotransferase [Rhodobacteraceae bacterium ASV31]|nr:gamma-glutamylcyclotransferase [Anianabacter salinae]MBV0912611.1 gamma-glutamylcyclotransferase [Anianabacter salinae]